MAFAARRPPLLGGAIARNCTRWLGDHNCGKPAVRHVLWDETMENGFVCAEHLAEIGTVWSYYAIHEVGPDCAMPGSLYFVEENACRCPDELVAAPEIEYAAAANGSGIEALSTGKTTCKSEERRRLAESNRWKVPDRTAQPCGLRPCGPSEGDLVTAIGAA